MIFSILNEVIKEDIPTLLRYLTNATPIEYKDISEVLDRYTYDRIFLSSDLHFMKDNDIVDDIKIKMHNSVISSNSNCVYINLGDIEYKKEIEKEDIVKDKIKLLNKGSYSILVKGNHDLYDNDSYIECGFSKVCRKGFIYKNMIFSHIPIKDNSFPNIDNYINIFGHLHEEDMNDNLLYLPLNKYSRKNRIKVYSKEYNYKPVSLQYLLSNHI